jgi:hypothetical protein
VGDVRAGRGLGGATGREVGAMGEAMKSVKPNKEPRTQSVLIDNLEVCKMLGVKPDTWRKRVASGISPLPFTVTGARSYYRLSDVRFYLRGGKWPARMQFRGKQQESVPGPDPE